MRHTPGCAMGKRTLRLGKIKMSLQVPKPEGSRAGQFPGWKEVGVGGPSLSLRAQRGKDPGLEDRA